VTQGAKILGLEVGNNVLGRNFNRNNR